MGKQPAELDIHSQALTTMTLPCRSQLAPTASRIRRSQAHSWSFDRQLWQHAVDLWRYGGHLQDLLFNAAGFPAQMIAIVRSQFPLPKLRETQSPDAERDLMRLMCGPDGVMLIEAARALHGTAMVWQAA